MPPSRSTEPLLSMPAEWPVDGHAAVILSLMSHQLRNPCPLLVRAIAGRLACLSQSCGDGTADALHRLADALLPQWRKFNLAVRH